MEAQASQGHGSTWVARHGGTVIVAMSIFLVAAIANPPRDGSDRMTVWEYKSLVFEVDGPVLKTTEDGRTISTVPKDRIPQLGLEGWELVTMVPTIFETRSAAGTVTTTSEVTYVYWLKRPKS